MAYINPKYVPVEEETERERRQKQFAAQLMASKRGPIDQTSYRNRQDEILRGGQQATQYETLRRNKREAAALEAARRKMEQSAMRQISLSVGQGRGPSLTPNYGANIPGVAGNFGKFLAAIAERESGGNYSARNRGSGAMGKYQIMPGNIRGSGRGWDYEALGRDISESQFMASPQLQEAIARYKLRQYYNKYGPWGAAVSWYAGPGALKYSSQSMNRRQGKYSSINTYANAILRRMGL